MRRSAPCRRSGALTEVVLTGYCQPRWLNFRDRITDAHRVDSLSPPLLLIIGWNLAVYASLLVWRWLPFGVEEIRPTLVRSAQ
jgi:hypothetical protein